jgi:hypothetical protein
VALPEHIAVQFTEEDAEYLSVRPVQRQTFRLRELVDMVLAVTGKDRARVQHILRTGSLVFHFYRYRWTGFEASAEDLDALLATFPDADASRAFHAANCVAVCFASGGAGVAPGQAFLPSGGAEVTREEAQRKRLFSAKTFWDTLMDCARPVELRYAGYSYARRADVYQLDLSAAQWQPILSAAEKMVSRQIRARLARCRAPARMFFLCPRSP